MKFYALRNDEWVTLTQILNHSELIVLYYIRTIDPFGEQFQETSTKSIAEILSISQRTVQRAMLKLSNLQLIKIVWDVGNSVSLELRGKRARDFSPRGLLH
jgi:DNA-binding CsgD family transcriptional regulator